MFKLMEEVGVQSVAVLPTGASIGTRANDEITGDKWVMLSTGWTKVADVNGNPAS